ncbi:MAG: hypothetical protein IKW00_04880 [Clostridia bacterium]|nr:hypothetical protein [Clostridia bacterium]
MKLYHMSESLHLGDTLTPDYQKCRELAEPFVQAIEKSEDCFYGMVLNGKYLFAVMDKSNLRMWADYAKWATEGVFEFIRRREYPHQCGRMESNYFFAEPAECKTHFDADWGEESEEVQRSIHLFEVEVEDDAPARRDMRIYDAAYDAMKASQDTKFVMDCARRYFAGEQTESPMWEIMSKAKATAIRDVTEILHPFGLEKENDSNHQSL